MDNSQYGTPSKEWCAYAAAHPDLHINEDGKHVDELEPVALREAMNAARIAASRAGMEKTGLRERVAIEEYAIPIPNPSSSTDTITLRAYRSVGSRDKQDKHQLLPGWLHFHGGGMLFGSPDGEDFPCARWADALGGRAVVLHASYRHTPEHTHPAQADDAWTAFEWVVAHAEAVLGVDPRSIVVGGISAGGQLAAGVAFRELARAKKQAEEDGNKEVRMRLRGQVLAVPWLAHRDAYPWEAFASRDRCSVVQAADAPLLPRRLHDLCHDLLKVADPRHDRRVSLAALATEEELRGMCRTAVVACGWDMLRDEAFLYAGKLDRAGVPTKKHVFDGMPHAFFKHADLPSSRRWHELLVESVLWILGDEGGRKEWRVEVADEYR